MKAKDEPTDEQALKAFAKRRAALAKRMKDLVDDAEHWNRTHPDEEPIVVGTDITDDVAEALAAREGKS